MSLVCAEQRAVVGCVGWLRGRAVTAHATRRGRLSYELSCIAVCVRRCDCDMCALACRTIGMRRDTEEIPRRGGGDGRRGASMGASRLRYRPAGPTRAGDGTIACAFHRVTVGASGGRASMRRNTQVDR